MNLKNLEQKLNDNYKGIQDPAIIEDIQMFLSEYNLNKSSSPDGVLFINKLVKVVGYFAYNGEKQAFSLRELISLHDYCKLGIDRMELDEVEEDMDDSTKVRINSYFYSHRANYAVVISKNVEIISEKISWLEKAHSDFVESSRTSATFNRKHCAYQYSLLADVERVLAELVDTPKEKIDWLKKAYSNYDESAKRLETLDKEHATYQYCFKVSVAEKLAELVDTSKEQIDWLEKVYNDYGESAKRLKSFDKKNGAYHHTLRADVAEKLAELVDTSKEQIDWLEKAYSNNIEGAITIKKLEKRHHAVTYLNAGRIAYSLYGLTGNMDYIPQAIGGYSTFVNYFEDNSELDLASLYRKAKKILEELISLEAQRDPIDQWDDGGPEIRNSKSLRDKRLKGKRGAGRRRKGGRRGRG